MKHLPITIVGPINATRPVMVLVGAFVIFGERLNAYQWTGVALALVLLFLLSRSSRREGVDFTHNLWILFIALSAVTGAVSGLYDKYIMSRLDPVFVQSWYNLYQFLMMSVVVAVLWLPRRGHTTPFRWSWAIPLISVFLTLADFAYLYALQEPDAMISIVSMIRRGSVVVSFLCGAALFHDMGKIQEISDFPMNDYTDDGQLLGHIYIGARCMENAAAQIPNFPPKLKNELVHCILAHHGKMEFGSPKVPAIMEAMALHMADNADAKLQTLTEVFTQAGDNMGWLGFNRM